MDFRKIFKDTNTFRKIYVKKQHIDSKYKEFNNPKTDINKLLTYFLTLLFISYMISFSLSFFIINFSFVMLVMFYTIYHAIKETFIFNILKKTYAFKFIKPRIFSNYLINKKLNDFFDKTFNKKEKNMINEISKIEETIIQEKIDLYQKEKKKNRFESQLTFYRRAHDNSHVSYFEIIEYMIKNSSQKYISELNKENLDYFIKSLSIEEKIKITNLLCEYRKKEDQLKDNLNYLYKDIEKEKAKEILLNIEKD